MADSIVLPVHALTLEQGFGHAIRGLRKARALRQADLAAATGFHERAIRALERGEKSPTLRTMEVFATFFGVPLEQLIVMAKDACEKSRATQAVTA